MECHRLGEGRHSSRRKTSKQRDARTISALISASMLVAPAKTLHNLREWNASNLEFVGTCSADLEVTCAFRRRGF